MGAKECVEKAVKQQEYQAKLVMSGLLSGLQDQAFAGALRRILFTDSTDWQFVWSVLKAKMPELELHEIEQHEKDTALPVQRSRGKAKLFKD